MQTFENLYNCMQWHIFVSILDIYRQFCFVQAAHSIIDLNMQIMKLSGGLANKSGKSQVEESIIISSMKVLSGKIRKRVLATVICLKQGQM